MIWQIAGWTMLHYLWIGAVLGVVAVAVRLLLRSRGTNLRYLAALACFAALGIAPLPIALVVSSRIPLPARSEPLAASEHVPNRTPRPPVPAIEVPPEPVATAPAVVSSSPPVPVPQPCELLQSALDRAAIALPWLWLVGAPLTFLLTTLGLLGAERLRRQSRLLDDSPIVETCRRLAKTLSVSGDVGVAICDRIAAPVLLGIFRPLILLPAVALTGWDAQQLEMVLLHELAHVRRWDNLVNLVQRVVESLLFFHPLVWIVSAWVRREREHCCDEFVVARTQQPRAYAEMLVRLSEKIYSPLPHGQVVSSMAERPLVARIRRILKKEEQSMQVSRKAFVSMFAGVFALAAIVGCYALLCRAEEAGQETNRGTAKSSATASRSTAENASEPVATSPAAKALLDAWTNRQRSVHTLHFSWLHTNIGNAETVVTPAQRQILDTTVSFDLDEKGRYRLESQGKIWQTEKSAYVPQTTTDVFDGQFQRNFVSCLPREPFPFAFVSPAGIGVGAGIGIETWAISFAYRPFDARIGIFDPTKLKMTAEQPIVDGRACIVLRQQDAHNYESIVWADSSRDFVPIRFIHGPKDNGHYQVDISYSKDARFGWVPTSWKVSGMDRQGRLMWSWGSTAVSYKLNETIPDGTFQAAYPTGTFVQNYSTKEAYILLENGEKRPVPRGVSIRENYNDLLHGKSPRLPPNVSQRGAAKAAPDGQPSLPPDQSALAAAARTQIKRFVTGTEVYQLDTGDYPTTKQGLQALRARPADIVNPNQWNGPYIEKHMPLDPWQRPYHYLYPGKHSRDVPDIWSLGPDGIDGTADDIGSWMENKVVPAKANESSGKTSDAKPASQITIAGQCIDDQNQPIANANVFLYRGDLMDPLSQQLLVQTVQTDRDGKFHFAPVADLNKGQEAWKRSLPQCAPYLILAQASGKATKSVLIPQHLVADSGFDADAFDATAASALKISVETGNLKLRMPQAAVLSGIVTGPDGKPVKGALVNGTGFITSIPGANRAITDSAGKYEIRDIQKIDLTKPPKGRGPFVRTMPLFVHCSGYADKQVDYSKVPGTVDVQLELAAVIQGRVVNGEDGRPAAGVRVQFQGIKEGGKNNAFGIVVTDTAGRYRLDSLGAGKYNIWAIKDGYTMRALDSIEAVSGTTTAAADIRLIRGGFIAGHVIDADTGRPFFPADAAAPPWFRPDVALYGPSRPQSGSACDLALIRPDGSFRLRAAPGSNHVYLRIYDLSRAVPPAAMDVDVAEGKTVAVDFKVRRKPAANTPLPAPKPATAAPKADLSRHSTEKRIGHWVVDDSNVIWDHSRAVGIWGVDVGPESPR